MIGAATAFGLTSLLPLNVPFDKPLMYCNDTTIEQAQLKFDDIIYSCFNGKVATSCARIVLLETTDFKCKNKMMECDLPDTGDTASDVYCSDGALMTRANIVCNSTFSFTDEQSHDNIFVLECYSGLYPAKLSSFIPTTTTEAPTTTTTAKAFSLSAHIHMILLDFIGHSDVYETTTYISKDEQELNSTEELWIPEALTLPPVKFETL